MTRHEPVGIEKTVGAEIRRRRTALGWSLRKLAEESRLDFGYVGKIERGEAPNVSLEKWAAIARALGTAVSTLFAAAEGPPKGRRPLSRAVRAAVAREVHGPSIRHRE